MIFKKAWFWTLLVGLLVGLYAGFQAGSVTGYQQAIDALRRIAPPIRQ